MGIGQSSGEGRALSAARSAIASPLLEASIEGARGILLSIAGNSELGLFEVNEAAEIIHDVAHPEANIIFGTVVDENMGDEIRVTVIAAGFDRWDGEPSPDRQMSYGPPPGASRASAPSGVGPVRRLPRRAVLGRSRTDPPGDRRVRQRRRRPRRRFRRSVVPEVARSSRRCGGMATTIDIPLSEVLALSVIITERVDGDFGVHAVGVERRRRALVEAPWTWLRLEHGATVVHVVEPGDNAGANADAAVTSTAGAPLSVTTADCAPVVMAVLGPTGVHRRSRWSTPAGEGWGRV